MTTYIILIRKLKKYRHENKELIIVMLLFVLAFIVFNLIIMYTEKLDLLSSFYFSFVTATTVGYGDISPSTLLGKWVTVGFMLISIGTLGTAIGIVTTKTTDFFAKKRKGMLTVKNALDLVIIGYPNEAKVKKIVTEFRNDSRHSTATIALITDKLKERASWMVSEDVFFVKGLASKKEILEQANISSAKRVLVLAEDPFEEVSDEYSSSAVIMSERLNPEAYTVAEKVREDKYLFEVAECDLVVSVSRAGELVQEMQDPGAIELAETIFSNSSEGNQYNLTIHEELSWKEIVVSVLEAGGTAVGFRRPREESFCFTPGKNDTVPTGSIIKYFALKSIANTSFQLQNR